MAQEKKTNEGGSSCFQIITVIGISPESWEKAAASAVEQASKMSQVAATEGIELTMHLENGKVGAYIAKVKLAANLAVNPK
jgi:hypothetical protein